MPGISMVSYFMEGTWSTQIPSIPTFIVHVAPEDPISLVPSAEIYAIVVDNEPKGVVEKGTK